MPTRTRTARQLAAQKYRTEHHTGVAYTWLGVPGSYKKRIREEDFRLSLSTLLPEGFWQAAGAQTAQSAAEWQRYRLFCLTILVQTINECVELFLKWADREWIHLAVKRLDQGFSHEQVARMCGVEKIDLRRALLAYDAEWVPSAWTWLQSAASVSFIEALDRDRADVVRVIRELVTGERRLGITEPDIRQLVNPGIRSASAAAPVVRREINSWVRLQSVEESKASGSAGVPDRAPDEAEASLSSG